MGVPLAQQLINSKGESLSEEFPDLIKEESKTASANNAALADAEFSEEDDHVDFKQDWLQSSLIFGIDKKTD